MTAPFCWKNSRYVVLLGYEDKILFSVDSLYFFELAAEPKVRFSSLSLIVL